MLNTLTELKTGENLVPHCQLHIIIMIEMFHPGKQKWINDCSLVSAVSSSVVLSILMGCLKNYITYIFSEDR